MKLHGLLPRLTVRVLGGRTLRHQVGPTSLAVHELGPAGAEPWVLVHGLGSTSLSWYPALKRLRGDCHLLVPELSLQGGTDAPFDGLNVREAVPAVIDLIERLVPGRPVVLGGISLGGWISVRIALERPDLVKALLLVAPAGYRNQDWLRVRDLLDIQGIDDVDPLMEALFHKTSLPVHWARRGFLRAYRSDAVRYVLESTSVEETFGPRELHQIEAPVGLVWGERDGIFPVAVGREMERSLARARLTVIPDCAHVVPWDCPPGFVRAIDDFRAWLGEQHGIL